MLNMRGMVCWHRVAGALASHSITAPIRWHRLLVPRICQARGANLRATVMRSRGGERRLGGGNRWHNAPSRHEGLCLRVECMVPIIASRNGVLALRVVGV